MSTMLLTCPESAHLEQIEYDQHELGVLILDCTAFPDRAESCPRTCAARLDRRCESKELAEGTVLIAIRCLRR